MRSQKRIAKEIARTHSQIATLLMVSAVFMMGMMLVIMSIGIPQ